MHQHLHLRNIGEVVMAAITAEATVAVTVAATVVATVVATVAIVDMAAQEELP